MLTNGVLFVAFANSLAALPAIAGCQFMLAFGIAALSGRTNKSRQAARAASGCQQHTSTRRVIKQSPKQ
jgi:hypothetical protein